MNITDTTTLHRALKGNYGSIIYEYYTTQSVKSLITNKLTNELPNFFYQRGLGFIRFYQVAIHDIAATSLLAYHHDVSYNDMESMISSLDGHYESGLTFMYDAVDIWLRLGNRAFFSGASLNRIYAKRGTLNSDEIDMFENGFGYEMEWLD